MLGLESEIFKLTGLLSYMWAENMLLARHKHPRDDGRPNHKPIVFPDIIDRLDELTEEGQKRQLHRKGRRPNKRQCDLVVQLELPESGIQLFLFRPGNWPE